MAKKRFWHKFCSKGKEDGNCCHSQGCGGCIYFLAFIGSAVYYIQNSTTFWESVVGVLKALVWPAILAYKLLNFL